MSSLKKKKQKKKQNAKCLYLIPRNKIQSSGEKRRAQTAHLFAFNRRDHFRSKLARLWKIIDVGLGKKGKNLLGSLL